MAKQFRMVPEDAEEAKWIHELMTAYIAGNLPELNKDLKLLRKRLSSAERWEEIASDLAEEESLLADEPTKPATIAKPPRATAAASGTSSAPSEGGVKLDKPKP